MSRFIDTLPDPKVPPKFKVIIASASRTGTLGLYSSMKTLGYKPYHMLEVVTVHGLPHMKALTEAVSAQANGFSTVKRFEKEDFDKLLGGYDCLIEVAFFLGMEMLEVYKDDPNTKFILTERDPVKWAVSFDKTCGAACRLATSLPISILKYFNSDVYWFLLLNQVIYRSLSDGLDPDHPRALDALGKNYTRYIRNVKRTLPEDRLKVIRLEEGLDWEDICPFLEMPIPDEPYPRGNEPEKFRDLMMGWMGPRMNSAMLWLGSIVVPVVGVLGWAGYQYGPSLYKSLV